MSRRLAGFAVLAALAFPASGQAHTFGPVYNVISGSFHEHKDIVYGHSGESRLWGLEGFDELYGMGGNDWLYGNGGADRLHGGPGFDRCDGGPGVDTFIDCEVISPD